MRFPAAGKYHAQVTEVTLSNHANQVEKQTLNPCFFEANFLSKVTIYKRSVKWKKCGVATEIHFWKNGRDGLVNLS